MDATTLLPPANSWDPAFARTRNGDSSSQITGNSNLGIVTAFLPAPKCTCRTLAHLGFRRSRATA